MYFRYFILVILFIYYGSPAIAQTDSIPSEADATTVTKKTKPVESKLNIVKINLFALPLKTITLQYERVINKFLSVGITGRYMPSMSMPYKNFIYNQYGGDDPEVKEVLDNMRISNFAVSPEVRFYLGKKGYGRGFYLAPAYRHARFSIDNLEYTFTGDQDIENSITMSGNMIANYGGFTVGAQWALGKHLILDWWIFAPFIGTERTNFSGNTNDALSQEDQYSLKQSLENIDLPYTTVTADVHEYGASVQLHGMMVGLSTGLAFGVRF